MTKSSLLTVGHLANQEIRNRTVVAPMTRISGMDNGNVGPLMGEYYNAFAEGGFGIIITEGVYTDQQFSQGYRNQPGITSSEHLESWKPLVQRVKSQGSKAVMQLMHAGALSQFNRFSQTTKGPSSITPKGEQMAFYYGQGGYATPQELTLDDIRYIIDSFVASAGRAKEAGFDGVEIHGANGYLLDQFLTDYTNSRVDQYGGKTENRISLTCEIAKAVKQSVGSDFIVGVRISQAKVNDYEYKWADGVQDAEIIFSALALTGIDYIHTTEYLADQPAFEDGLSLAAYAKMFSGLPVIANGSLHEMARAEKMINTQSADFVSLGRGALANSDWPKLVKKKKTPQEFNPEILSPYANLANAIGLSKSA